MPWAQMYVTLQAAVCLAGDSAVESSSPSPRPSHHSSGSDSPGLALHPRPPAHSTTVSMAAAEQAASEQGLFKGILQ